MKYDDRDDNGENDRNEDGNNDDNSTIGSGSDGPVLDLITTPRPRLGLAEQDWATTATALQPRRNMYICVALYI